MPAHSPEGGGGRVRPRARRLRPARASSVYFAPSHMPYEIDRCRGRRRDADACGDDRRRARGAGAEPSGFSSSSRRGGSTTRGTPTTRRPRRGRCARTTPRGRSRSSSRTGTRTWVVGCDHDTGGLSVGCCDRQRDGRRRAPAPKVLRGVRRVRDHRRVRRRADERRGRRRAGPRDLGGGVRGGRAGRGRGGEPARAESRTVGGASRDGEESQCGVRPGEWARTGPTGTRGGRFTNARGEGCPPRARSSATSHPRAHGRGRGGKVREQGRRRSGGTRRNRVGRAVIDALGSIPRYGSSFGAANGADLIEKLSAAVANAGAMDSGRGGRARDRNDATAGERRANGPTRRRNVPTLSNDPRASRPNFSLLRPAGRNKFYLAPRVCVVSSRRSSHTRRPSVLRSSMRFEGRLRMAMVRGCPGFPPPRLARDAGARRIRRTHEMRAPFASWGLPERHLGRRATPRRGAARGPAPPRGDRRAPRGDASKLRAARARSLRGATRWRDRGVPRSSGACPRRRGVVRG